VQSGGEDENHWPGYVDALTTMTMMLIFVMMILAVALFGMSENVSRSIVEKIAQSAGVQVDTDGVDTTEIARRVAVAIEAQREGRHEAQAALRPNRPAQEQGSRELTAQVEGVEKVVDAGKGLKTDIPASLVNTNRAPSLLTLKFQPRATAVDELATEEIKTFVNTRAGSENGPYYELRAFARTDGGTVSDSRRVAYYRAMAVRSRLIGAGVMANRITLSVLDHQGAEGADRVEIGLKGAGAPVPR
jgi:Na+-transporting methylmalonyl-CoA/oxaloacetate decarboxylase gamma subunit